MEKYERTKNGVWYEHNYKNIVTYLYFLRKGEMILRKEGGNEAIKEME